MKRCFRNMSNKIRVNSSVFQDRLWTALSISAHFTYASIITLITTRFTDLTTAGVLALAIAIMELLRIVAIFGISPFQATDVKQTFCFSTYLHLRCMSTVLSLVVVCIVLIVGEFDLFAITVVSLVFLIYSSDSFFDVFICDLQQKSKMRVAGRIRATGYLGAMMAFTVTLFTTGALKVSLMLSWVAILNIYIIWIYYYRNHFTDIRSKTNFLTLRSLTSKASYILATSIIATYLANAQKYYLRFFESEEFVIIYAIIVMPSALFHLLCNFIFQGGELTKTAEIFAQNEYSVFLRRVRNQALLIIALYIPFIVSVYLLGIPLIALLYGIDFSEFRTNLLIMSFGGVFFVISSLLSTVLVIMRKQGLILLCSLVCGFFVGPIMLQLVREYGFTGAAYFNVLLYAPSSVILCIFFVRSLKAAEKE